MVYIIVLCYLLINSKLIINLRAILDVSLLIHQQFKVSTNRFCARIDAYVPYFLLLCRA